MNTQPEKSAKEDEPPLSPSPSMPDAALQQERARIAQLLHDGPCQTINGLQFLVHASVQKINTVDPELGGQLKAAVGEAAKELLGVLRSLRERQES